MNRRALLALVPIALAMLTPGVAAAETKWPTKPLRIIVPWPPGGAADISVRHLQQPLSEVIGQPVIVDNKSGGGGIVGTDALARAPADGSTIGMVISSHASNTALHNSLPYDAVKDFKPITILTAGANVVIVHPSAPYKTLTDIITAAKANPGKMHYVTSGNGTAQHLGFEYVKLATGIKMDHVPYKGAGPALNDLVAGQVQIGVLNIGGVMPYVHTGRLRAIAVTSPKRTFALPDTPSIAETVPGFDFTEWFALMAPAGVPDEVVEQIYQAVKKAASTPTFVEKVKEGGMEPVLNTPAEFKQIVADSIVKFKDLVQRANIKLD
jgi:tripartite-type tricarboxylate transporter receptor subunit TctC